MVLFGKKEKSGEPERTMLPALPRLPDFPDMVDDGVRQLPSFPSNSIGKKFSQDSIKDAVSGGKNEGDEGFYADEFSQRDRMMQDHFKGPATEELEETFPVTGSKEKAKTGIFRQEAEPVFVRIDRFEEGLKLFENVKLQISDIERMVADTKRLKEKEEAEIHAWEDELKRMKEEIEKIGATIFSKV